MDPILVSATTSFLTTLATKGADGPAETLNLIWKNAFFKVDYLLKNRLIQLENFDKLSKEVTDNISKIPEENIVEPINYSLINTVDNAFLTVDQEDLRQMFSKLIASHFDFSKQSDLHPSFIEIIKQLSPNDAILLREISRKKSIPIGKYVCFPDKDKYSHISLTEPFFLPFINDYTQTINSLQNLKRLNLVDVDMTSSFTKTSLYSSFENDRNKLDIVKNASSFIELIQITKAKHSMNNAPEDLMVDLITLKKGIAQITNFGRSFYNVCG